VRFPATALLAAASALVLPSCGYRLAGTGTFLGANIKKSTRPEIEIRTTEEVARELASRGGFKVVDKASADAYLEGAVTDFRTTPVQFNDQGRATRLETTVVLRASLRDLSSGAILWSQANLIFRDQYDVQQTDVNYFDLETLALEDLAKGAADTLVSSITEGF